jgi:hypothetical protein
MDIHRNAFAPKTLESWRFVQQMLADLTASVTEDAIDERELIEGLQVVAKIIGLCAELSVQADPERPAFFDMCSDTRMIGGPNPDGRYLLAMIRGDRAYRVTGTRGTTAYLGFQVLAGTGLTPRRMAGYLSDTELDLDSGAFEIVFSPTEPQEAVLGSAQWVRIPEDASSIVVREYVGDFAAELPATMRIDPINPDDLRSITDEVAAEQIKPELLTQPNVLVTAAAAELGGADTTPDNLYMIGTFGLEPDESLVLEFRPPATRYWNVTLESIWHECLEPRVRNSSVTNKALVPDGDGVARIAIGAKDSGYGHWLDTGGRRRGFIILRWLDNPDPPDVLTTVRRGGKAS